MTPLEKQTWERLRRQGRTRFILNRGILREGLIAGVFLNFGPLLYDIFTHNKEIPSVWNVTVGFLIITFVVGIMVGELFWRKNEEDYANSAT